MSDIYVGQLMSSTYLEHYGVKGMKWGVRRYQNKDGTRTAAGKKRDIFTSETRRITKRLSNHPRPILKQPVDFAKVKERGKLNNRDAETCVQIANSLFNTASKMEPAITSDIVKAVSKTNGKMYGLNYRLKQPTSLAGKIGSDARDDGVSFIEAGRNIKDLVRYTAVSDNRNFYKNYRSIDHELKTKGYTQVKLKNYFSLYKEGRVQHKAVQCTYKDPRGFSFEVQFQTPESQAAKELKLPLYEEARKQTTSVRRRKELEIRMHELAEHVPYPEDIFKIGK